MPGKSLQDIAGNENCADDEDVLEAYSSDMSLVPHIKPKQVVKVQKAEQVAEVIKWANETNTPLLPISSGAPHFRGDTVPTAGGTVVVDMSGLKNIIRVDAENRIAMVEAGVTFGELAPRLMKAGLRLNMPLLPRAGKSVVASMLDREPVVMPWYQWDSQDPLTCVEVVFGSGDLFWTGSAAGPGTLEEQWHARQAQVNPMGPGQTSFGNVLQGAQGTLGIVTWATIRCEILPQLQKPFFVGSDSLEKLSGFAYRVLWRKAAEECFILDGTSLAAMTALDTDEDERLKSSLPPWVLFFCLAGFDYYPEEKIAYQEKALAEEAEKAGLTFDDSLAEVPAAGFLEMVQRPAGEPYWKTGRKGACQDICFLTTLDRVPRFVEVMREQAALYGYPAGDIGTYVQPMVQGTSCQCEFELFYDPRDPRDVERIRELYFQAGVALMNAGAFFSRPYGVLVDEIYRRDAAMTAALKKVKQIFDPNNIMNPGKLCF